MTSKSTLLAGVLLSALLFMQQPLTVPATAAPSATDAKSLWKTYETLGNSFDAGVADLYTDDAVIQSTRYYPNGQTKTMTLTGAQYKPMIVQAMPVAKARNDRDTYKNITYTKEGARVRIKALRHNLLKNYDSWLVLLVEKRGSDWKIVQEQSQTRP